MLEGANDSPVPPADAGPDDPRAPRPAPWSTIALIGGAAAVAVLVVAVLSVSHRHFERQLVRSFQDHQLTIARSVASAAEEILAEVEQDLRYLTKDSDIVALNTDTQAELDAFVATHGDAMHALAVLDAQGRVVCRSPRTPKQPEAPRWPEFDAARDTGKPHVGAPDSCISDPNVRAIRVAVPMREGSRFRGVIVGCVDLRGIWAKCLSRPETGRSSTAWVVDSRGEILHDTNGIYQGRTWHEVEDEWRAAGNDGDEREERAEEALRKRVQDGEEGTAALHNNTVGGVDELIAFTPISFGNTRYGLAIVTPKSEIAGPITANARMTYAMIGGMLVFLLLTGHVATRASVVRSRLLAEQRHAGDRQRTLERLQASEGSARGARERSDRMNVELTRRADELEAARRASLNLADDLERALRQAQAGSRAKSAFLANMSHEIRTPMTAILGFADLLTDPDLAPGQSGEHVAVIRRNGEHLLALINDVLDLSKIEAGKLATEIRPCSILSIVADVASFMRIRADQHDNSLTVEYPGPMPASVRTDAARLRQALVNLVDNAAKFTTGGSVRIVARFLPQWRHARPAVRIDVADTGIGIGPDQLPTLFEPFVQADASTSRRYGGSGLGLAITRHIAELLDGELAVASELGQGSTFTLTLPTGPLDGVDMLDRPGEAGESDDAPPAASPIRPEALAGVRILLAEDGRDNQTLIRAVLTRAGAAVDVAANGRIAVDMADDDAFGLVLMDMQMPEMDGYEAAAALRQRGFGLPILALTAHAMSGDREKCLAAGCDDYITKPIDRHLLVRTIARHLGRAVDALEPSATPADHAHDGRAVQSTLDAEPDLAGLIDQFVGRLPGRVKAMRDALDAGLCEMFRRLAHQLKGAGGSYGYQSLTDAARAAEEAAKREDLEAMNLELAAIADLCKAISRGRQTPAAADA